MLTYLLIQRALTLAISHMYTSSRPVVHVKARFCISLSDSTTSASQLEKMGVGDEGGVASLHCFAWMDASFTEL